MLQAHVNMCLPFHNMFLNACCFSVDSIFQCVFVFSNHMFLCIRSKQKMTKTFSTSGDDDNDLAAEGNKYPEYWFQVPRKKYVQNCNW